MSHLSAISAASTARGPHSLDHLPREIQILALDFCDLHSLIAASRTSRATRSAAADCQNDKWHLLSRECREDRYSFILAHAAGTGKRRRINIPFEQISPRDVFIYALRTNNLFAAYLAVRRMPPNTMVPANDNDGAEYSLSLEHPEGSSIHQNDTYSILAVSAHPGLHDLALLLIQRGEDVNRQSSSRMGSCPLEVALRAHHFPLALKLVDQGANPLVRPQSSSYRDLFSLASSIRHASKPPGFDSALAERHRRQKNNEEARALERHYLPLSRCVALTPPPLRAFGPMPSPKPRAAGIARSGPPASCTACSPAALDLPTLAPAAPMTHMSVPAALFPYASYQAAAAAAHGGHFTAPPSGAASAAAGGLPILAAATPHISTPTTVFLPHASHHAAAGAALASPTAHPSAAASAAAILGRSSTGHMGRSFSIIGGRVKLTQ